MVHDFDVLIVGAGAAGAVLATRLSERADRRVGLIEAGPDFPDLALLPDKLNLLPSRPKSSDPFTLEDPDENAEPAPYEWHVVARGTDQRPRVLIPQGRVTGGTTSINAALFVRGTREDFNSWAAVGNSEWTYEKVLPYYRKLETDVDFNGEFHGSEGPVHVVRIPETKWEHSDFAFESACLALGHVSFRDQNHPDATGVGPVPRNSINGIRTSTARTYLSTTRQRPNLEIISNCVVERVIFDGTSAIGVMARRDGTEPTLIRANRVVLSAGAIRSPQLLMLSGIGPADHLTELGIPVLLDRPGVGQNLRDHPGVAMYWRRDVADATTRGGALGVPGVGAGALYLRFTAADPVARNDCRIMSPRKAEVAGYPETAGLDTMLAGLFLAAGAGKITLRSCDPVASTRVDFNYLAEESDRRRMRETVRMAEEIAHTGDMHTVVGSLVDPGPAVLRSDEELDRWLLSKVRSGYHLTSTAKMGPSTDPLAVVDQFGAVHGLEGLYVADASIMPNCVSHNTQATTIMIGEYLSDRIGALN